MQTKEFASLSGSVAVVTGGGRGIGQAIVTRLAGMGATVVLTGRDETRVQQVARDLEARGHRAEGIACDVTSLESVEALGERSAQELRPRRHSGEQRRHRWSVGLAARTCARGLGRHLQHQSARRVLHAAQRRASDDRKPGPATLSTSPRWQGRTRCLAALPIPLPNGD